MIWEKIYAVYRFKAFPSSQRTNKRRGEGVRNANITERKEKSEFPGELEE